MMNEMTEKVNGFSIVDFVMTNPGVTGTQIGVAAGQKKENASSWFSKKVKTISGITKHEDGLWYPEVKKTDEKTKRYRQTKEEMLKNMKIIWKNGPGSVPGVGIHSARKIYGVTNHISAETREKLFAGEITLNQAYDEIRKPRVKKQ